MTTTAGHQCHETHAAGARRRQLRMMQLFFTGAAVIAMLALFDAARPDTTETTRKPLSKRGGREVRPSCAIWATSRSRIRACNGDQRTALID
jgi:hypothetical protein